MAQDDIISKGHSLSYFVGARPFVACLQCGHWAESAPKALKRACSHVQQFHQTRDRGGAEVLRWLDKGRHPRQHDLESARLKDVDSLLRPAP